MNISILIGLVVAFGGLIAGFLLDKGNLMSLVLVAPFLIVIGGTFGAVIASYGLDGLLGAVKSFNKSLSKKNQPDPEKLIKKIGNMADMCRAEGLLKLQAMLDDADLKNDDYMMLKEGMILATDTKNVESMRDTLEADIHTYSAAREQEIGVFEGAAGFSPTMGVVGTVMGLTTVLASVDDPSALTKGIASAFIATLYGVAFANVIYLPFANHMRTFVKRQIIFREIIIDGMCMLISGESSRNIENKLSLYYHAFPGCEEKYKAGIDN